MPERTQVGIVGAGPAGLVLGQLLHRAGIDAVVLEARDREYVEQRVRAGVLEQGTVDLLKEMGVGERLEREGLVHHGVELRFDGEGHRIPFGELTNGRGITIYGQQEVVKDLIAARLDEGAELLFDVEDVSLHELDSERPSIRFRHGGEERELRCDVDRRLRRLPRRLSPRVARGALTIHERDLPVRLARHPRRVAPVQRGAHLLPPRPRLRAPQHALARGHAALPPVRPRTRTSATGRTSGSGRSSTCGSPREGWSLDEGPVIEKGITPMRSFVAAPMQHGRLYLAGDAVHIVPPTGAKGLNLAVGDVRVLAEALVRWFESGDDSLLRAYSDTCLGRVWRTQFFSWWMTSMFHRMPDDHDGFQARLQRAQLAYVCSSRAAATSLAESYVGAAGDLV